MDKVLLTTRDVDGLIHEITEEVIRTLLDRGFIRPEGEQDHFAKDLLNHTEAAKLLGIDESKVQVWMCDGKAPRFREIPGSEERKYSRKELTEFALCSLRHQLSDLQNRVPSPPGESASDESEPGDNEGPANYKSVRP